MNQKLGMDTGTARAKQSAMQLQINALSAIASDLSTTYTAARNPQMYGIEPGEKSIAPWSMAALNSARIQLQGAQSAANGLLQQINSHADAQESASGNDDSSSFPLSLWGGYQEFSGWRSWLSRPRSVLELPAALRMAAQQPSVWRTGLNPANWGIRGANEGGAALRNYTRTLQTPGWIRTWYQGASNLKFQNYVDPTFLHSRGLHSSPVGRWTDVFHSARIAGGLKTAAVAAGKGFAVLGIASGVVDVVGGISGMTDGEITSDDAWQLADGLVNTITGVGSLAPPPVGLVFAGVGLAYNAGRWLFGEDGNGKTGIDKIGDFGKATGEFLGDVGEGIGNVVEDLWPW